MLYLNVGAAVAAIIEYDGSVLASVRAKDPDAGKLDLPGGFVDRGETAEQALRRELEEELNLKEITPVYFGTYPNIYPYKSVTYHTLDLIFTIKLRTIPDITPADDVASIKWIKKSDLEIQDFAFSSMRAALSAYTKAA
ncbi:MAG: NUDIX domain-containing protein [Acidiferrobacterales bacterium]